MHGHDDAERQENDEYIVELYSPKR